MTDIKQNYRWEAERADGSIKSDGGDISDCVRYSLIPGPGVLLPRHDFINAPLVRRFVRVFHKVPFNTKEDFPGLIFWKSDAQVIETSEDLTAVLHPGDMVGKGVAGEDWYLVVRVTPTAIHLATPYRGKSKPKGMFGRKIDRQIRMAGNGPKVIHCVEMVGSRVWVDDATGAVLVTDQEREVNL